MESLRAGEATASVCRCHTRTTTTTTTSPLAFGARLVHPLTTNDKQTGNGGTETRQGFPVGSSRRRHSGGGRRLRSFCSSKPFQYLKLLSRCCIRLGRSANAGNRETGRVTSNQRTLTAAVQINRRVGSLPSQASNISVMK